LNAEGGQAKGRAVSAASCWTVKGISPIAGEVKVGGNAGGKVVHFYRPLAFAADDLLCATTEIMGMIPIEQCIKQH